MKKIVFFLMLIVIAVATGISQETADTTNVPIITGGESVWEILKANLWTIALIAFSCLDLWLSQTGKVKEGSFLAIIINWIGRLIRKQLPVVKGKFMSDAQIKAAKGIKVIVLLILLSGLSSAAYSQGVFSQFGKITRGTKVELLRGEGDKILKWYVKPTAELSAMNLVRNKETDKWEGSPFTAAGLGAGIQHYVEHNGVLANDYGFNALFIINFNDPSNVGFGIAGTVNILDFVNAGGGFDFTNEVPLILFGASWKF